MKSSLPLRAYVGFRKSDTSWIKIHNLSCYSVLDWVFRDIPFEKVNKQSQAVVSLLSKEFDTFASSGLDIYVLSEVERGNGLWFSWVFASLLISGFYILQNKLSKKDFLSFHNSDKFDEIVRLAWQIELISKWGNAGWENTMMTLLGGDNPRLFFCEQFSPQDTSDFAQHLKYHAPSFVEHFGDNLMEWKFPFDYVLVNSWTLTDTHHIEANKRWDKNKAQKYHDFLMDYFGNLQWNYYFSNFLNNTNFYEFLSDDIVFLSLKNLYYLKDLLTYGDDVRILDGYIQHVNDFSSLTYLLQKIGGFGQEFQSVFHNKKSHIAENIWIMPIYTWTFGGSYLLILKPNISRSTITHAMDFMLKNRPNSHLLYCSWWDENADKLPHIEQYVSWSQFSEYVGGEQFLYKNNQGCQYLADYSFILEKEQDGFLLDLTTSKIYLNGEKLTSKEIKSQSTTVELFAMLLERNGEEVYNNELSPSSYSGQQNQMLWKIILPLIRLVEEKYWKKLPLQCKGSLRDFYVKLEETDVKFGIVKRI